MCNHWNLALPMNIRLWCNQKAWTSKNGPNANIETRHFLNKLVTSSITPKNIVNGSNQPRRSVLIILFLALNYL